MKEVCRPVVANQPAKFRTVPTQLESRMDRIIPWERLWHEPRHSIEAAHEYYLEELRHRMRVKQSLITLEQAAGRHPCLVLVGDAGMGKTTTVRRYCEDRALGVGEGRDVIYVDLAGCSSDSGVRDSIVESPEFRRWRDGDHILEVFLDSFDECAMSVQGLGKCLVMLLRKLGSPQRLRVRICCRINAWPSRLSGELEKIWDPASVKTFVLAPLRKCDVHRAAEESGVASDGFLRRIEQLRMQPFAARPVTLNLLLRKFAATGSLPDSQAALYLEGCRLLCEEDDRRDSGRAPLLTADERLAVAGRIAAAVLLTGSDAVWTRSEASIVGDGDRRIRELVGGSERTRYGASVPIGDEEIRDTLGSGLFSRGPDQVRFAHRTYAEYLAAHYLVTRAVSSAQLIDLLQDPSDTGRRLAPHLRAVAAWAAILNAEYFDAVLDADPGVLLRSDVIASEDRQRERLAAWLLAHPDVERPGWRTFETLDHPGLEDQLRPVLLDAPAGHPARAVAVAMASACGLSGFAERLAEIAADPREDLEVRASAADTALRTGSKEVRRSIGSLVAGRAGDPAGGELVGYAFHALWPGEITVDEILRAARTSQPHGSDFASFFTEDWVSQLGAEDTAKAVRWASGPGQQALESDSGREFMDALIAHASAHVAEPGFRDALICAVIKQLEDNADQWEDPYVLPEPFRKDEIRRELVESLVTGDSRLGKNLFYIPPSFPHVLTTADVPWLAEQHAAASDPTARGRWWSALRGAVYTGDAVGADALLAAAERSPHVRRAYRHLLQSVDLGSPRAGELRRRRSATPQQAPRPHGQGTDIVAAVLRYRAGHSDAVQLLERLFPSRGQSHSAPEWNASEWGKLDPKDRATVLEAALHHVTEHAPGAEPLGRDRRVRLGCKALYLLQSEQPDLVCTLEEATVAAWLPSMLQFVTLQTGEVDSTAVALLKSAERLAPAAYTAALLRAMTLLVEDPDLPFLTCQSYGRLFAIGTAAAVRERLRTVTMPSHCLGEIVAGVLRSGGGAYGDVVVDVLDLRCSGGNELRTVSTVLASLLREDPQRGWSWIWKHLATHRFEIGCALDQVGSPERGDDLLLGVPSNRIAELLLAFDDPAVRTAVAEQRIGGGWLSGFLYRLERLLEERRDRDTREVLRRQGAALSRRFGLVAAVREANWTPLTAAEVLSLRGDSEQRLVRGADHLLDLVRESLTRLQAHLAGDIPAVRDLWDRDSEGRWRPVDEEEISDYLKRWLDLDLRGRGIVAGREVKILGRFGGVPGQRVDIHLQAALGPAGEVYHPDVRVIVEVKGSWNPCVRSDMKDQLGNRYLKDQGTRHGLYVVGWFESAAWDKSDRRRRVKRQSREELISHLEAQARTLSSDGYRVEALVIDAGLPEDR